MRSSKKLVFFAAWLAIAAGGLLYMHRPEEPVAAPQAVSAVTAPSPSPSPAPSPAPAARVEATAEVPRRKARVSALSSKGESDLALRALGDARPPTTAQVRSEAERDPESPSSATRAFAIELERKMEPALESESSARALLPGLEACATDRGSQQVAESARVLCLSNADRLAKRFPELKVRYQSLESQVDSRVLQLKKMMDLQ